MKTNLETSQLHPDKMILKEVQYGKKSIVDEKDQSHVFYEVQKDTACGTLKIGDIVKTSTRIFQSVQIDGETYFYTNTDERILTIKKEDINEQFLTR